MLAEMIRYFSKPFLHRGIGKFPLFRPIVESITSYYATKIVTRTPGGLMRLNPNRFFSFVFHGIWEPEITNLFSELAKKSRIIVDVGAYCGYYTLLGASLVKKGGTVFAIEPEPSNYKVLAENVKMNRYQNVVLVNKAAYSRIGTAKLYLSFRNSGSHSLLDHPYLDKCSIDVKTTTVDNLLKSVGYRCDLIKIDAEGAELEVIKGMRKTLNANKNIKIIMELFKPNPSLLAHLQRKGFRFFLIKNGYRMYPIRADSKEAGNVYCKR